MRASWFLCAMSLIWREVVVFLKIFKSKLIDLVIIISTNLIVFAYLMPFFGMQTSYGPFILAGVIPLLAFFEIIARVSVFVSDLTGNKKISYLLTLPLPSWMTILSIGLGWACCNMLYTILILPFGKLVLWDRFDLAAVSYWRFIIIFFSYNIFFGFFSLWLSGLIKDMKYMTWIWSRVVNPMLMLGCYFYSWSVVYSASHIAGWINLAIPIVYVEEGMRSAILGPKGYLSYWWCLFAIWSFIIIFGWSAVSKLKKRLDCV